MKRIYYFLCALALVCTACVEDGIDITTITRTVVDAHTSTADFIIYVSDQNGNRTAATIEEIGVFISTSANPTKQDHKVTLAIDEEYRKAIYDEYGALVITVEGLASNTTYYALPFISNRYSMITGEVVSFTTKGSATVTTNAATNVTSSSAKLNGSVSSNGGDMTISKRGFLLSLSSNPMVGASGVDNWETKGKTGDYAVTYNDLDNNTKYYFRAYAIVNDETIYGTTKSFTTAFQEDQIEMELEDVSSNTIYPTNANLSGTINIGNKAVGTLAEVGFVWSTSSSPTINNDKWYWSGTSSSSGDNEGFDTWVGVKRLHGMARGLNAGTKYYYRMYYKLKNSSEVVYTAAKSFTTAGGEGTDGGTVTIAQFKNKPDDVNTWYTVSGVIYDIASTTYGNLYLADETGLLIVYGVTATKQNGTNDQSFASLGLNIGDYITIKAPKITYNGIPEAKNGYLISKSSIVPSFTTFALEPTEKKNLTLNAVTNVSADVYNYQGGYEGEDWQRTTITLTNANDMSVTLKFYSYGTIDATLGIVPGTYDVHNTSNYYVPHVMWQSQGYSAQTNSDSGCMGYKLGAFSDFAPYYIQSGSVTIEKVGTKARIAFDLSSYYGSTITGDVTVDIKSNLTSH